MSEQPAALPRIRISLDLHSLDVFCDRWIQKSEQTSGDRLADAYDRFFALWVVYNRLYEEAARMMVAGRHSEFAKYGSKARRQYNPAPEGLSATRGVTMFCKRRLILPPESVAYIIQSIDEGRFYFHENYETEMPDFEKDKELASKRDAASILTLIYRARCNLFHGQKEFNSVQLDLLHHMSEILASVIGSLRERIDERHD
jgi:hypothetical protein